MGAGNGRDSQNVQNKVSGVHLKLWLQGRELQRSPQNRIKLVHKKAVSAKKKLLKVPTCT